MLSTAVALKRATPEYAGLSSKDILDFIDAVETSDLELHSLMIVKNRHVIAEGWWEPYARDDVHLLWSLSKSFTSTAIGFAVQEGLIQLDDPVISFFPSQLAPNPSDKLQAMKIRHLLTMSTGHAADDMTEMYGREDGDWVRGFLAREVVYEPGTHFLYNSSASYVLSAIISRVTGFSTLDYLRPRLLDPLGIEKATWDTCPNGISTGGWGLSITTESIARFGLFYLEKGLWNGYRLLNEEWIEDATRFHVSNEGNDQPDWRQGYGFQFWRSRHDCYRGDGAFGQFCVVIPAVQMVVAITASVSSMQAVLDLVWKHLQGPARVAYIPENEDWQLALKARLATLTLPSPSGRPTSPLAATVTGHTYQAPGESGLIKACTFELGDEGCTLILHTESGIRTIRAGSSHWVHGESNLELEEFKKIAAIGHWTSEETYEIKVRYTESPYGITIVSSFGDDKLKLTSTLTARFGTSEGPTFEGTKQ